MSTPCICESGQSFEACCQPILEGRLAQSAEALMRSRFTAYAIGDTEYLMKTWHPSTRPSSMKPNPNQKWLGLKIKESEAGPAESFVEFVARFKVNGKGHRLHERSRFVCEDGAWYYIDGILGDTNR